jgi:hypothetical protein
VVRGGEDWQARKRVKEMYGTWVFRANIDLGLLSAKSPRGRGRR